MDRQATLNDVALRVGVHRSTVSLALRNHPRISAQTRQRIKTVAEELGYRVNPIVAALMHTRRTGRRARQQTIAFVTNHPSRFGWQPRQHDGPDFFPGAARRARELGCRLEPFWFAEPGMTPKRFRDILVTRNVHGLLIAPMPPGQNRLVLQWDTFSVVAVGMTLRAPRFHCVTENHFDTATQTMQRCLAKGYRRIGFVFSEDDESSSVGACWFAAYLQFQRAHPEIEILPVCPGAPPDQLSFKRWFSEVRPDALVATHSPPVLEWLRDMDRKVPRDVGLVGLQDNSAVGMSGVYHDPGKIGALAIEMLTGLMYRNETGVPTLPYETALTGEWHEGTTLPEIFARTRADRSTQPATASVVA